MTDLDCCVFFRKPGRRPAATKNVVQMQRTKGKEEKHEKVTRRLNDISARVHCSSRLCSSALTQIVAKMNNKKKSPENNSENHIIEKRKFK